MDVQQAIEEQNIQVAAGRLGQAPAPPGTQFEFQVDAVGRLSDPQQFGNIVIRAGTTSEAVVRLHDVARIELGALQYTSSARFNDKPTVFIAVYQTPGSNALQVDREIRTRMAELAKRFPAGSDQLRHDDLRLCVDA
jgi:multidrug efflux pump subunit AcrB